jgi:glycosyltransferase involved in cell wall biosynthesis
MSATVDVLLPTYNRLESLIMTLSGLTGQLFSRYHLIVSDQSDEPARDSQVVQSLLRILEALGSTFEWHYRVPSLGIAEQRDFLLSQSSADYVLYLDNDVWMEPWVLQTLMNVITEQGCGFVGAFPYGLSFRNDIRPAQQFIEFWNGRVEPEILDPDTPAWDRNQLHRAANSYHVAQKLPPAEIKLYKVAWIAACILYDRRKLLDIGGFSFWSRLPRYQSGEEVVVQNLLLRKYGGCAILPSGTYFSELPSTVLNDTGTVDNHALSLLPELVHQFVPESLPAK